MNKNFFTSEDLRQIKEKGITPEKVLSQIEVFRRGIPYINLKRPCTIGDGIVRIGNEKFNDLIILHKNAASHGRIAKFVPASGASSRMFKQLLALNSMSDEVSIESLSLRAQTGDKTAGFGLRFFQELGKFAFYDELKSTMSTQGLNIESLPSRGDLKPILKYLLTSKGMNFSNLPKGLITFHRYEDHNRTPFEEHMVEGMALAQGMDNTVRIHFTVSNEHFQAFQLRLEGIRKKYEKDGITFDISFSTQNESTDTIAVDMNDQPFRDMDGRLLFRPGGHGALIENLNDLHGDIIFIKNIDNVVPDRMKADTHLYMKVLCGWLVMLQNTMFHFLKLLEKKDISNEMVDEAMNFAAANLSIIAPKDFNEYPHDEKLRFLFTKLNRPLRICGMVRNIGEPGGGPFWVENDDSLSLQIVEAAQVNGESPEQMRIWKSATHFNPVLLVCGLRDYRGQPFNLHNFINHDTGFISMKSKDGRELKALELPGLWNGSMAFGNTVFVETPISTFNPVKTVNDLLKKEHQ